MRQLARITRIRRRYALATAVFLSAVAALAVSSLGNSASTPAAVSLAGISPSVVSVGGLDLSAAQSASPAAVTGENAADTASQAYGGRSVLDEHYVHCVERDRVPPVSQDCWVVALDTTGMTTDPPAGSRIQSQQLAYFFVLVDPATGKVIASQGGN
jgi:hypothetical protein